MLDTLTLEQYERQKLAHISHVMCVYCSFNNQMHLNTFSSFCRSLLLRTAMISMLFFSVLCCRSVSCWLTLLSLRVASRYSTRELSVRSHLASHRAAFALALSISDSLSRFDSCLPSFFPFLDKKNKNKTYEKGEYQNHKVKLFSQIQATFQILKTNVS